MCLLGQRRVISQPTARAGILDEHAEAVVVRQAVGQIGHNDVEPQRQCARPQDGDRLREDVGVDVEPLAR